MKPAAMLYFLASLREHLPHSVAVLFQTGTNPCTAYNNINYQSLFSLLSLFSLYRLAAWRKKTYWTRITKVLAQESLVFLRMTIVVATSHSFHWRRSRTGASGVIEQYVVGIRCAALQDSNEEYSMYTLSLSLFPYLNGAPWIENGEVQCGIERRSSPSSKFLLSLSMFITTHSECLCRFSC